MEDEGVVGHRQRNLTFVASSTHSPTYVWSRLPNGQQPQINKRELFMMRGHDVNSLTLMVVCPQREMSRSIIWREELDEKNVAINGSLPGMPARC